eukprot:TRINITY_DN43127_c0_g1_i1.p1 TRINITY_DN43127_c0_g1~~TRINITY_DN43127_c0_g1_i1.p1  ORF type:complete len:562 (-),score=104.60 TRINITY_DN43127_c0_g1_i1:19-1512(-)
MGFCYENSNPDSCWVKRHGAGFSSDEGWTSVVLDEHSLARRKQLSKLLRHNVVVQPAKSGAGIKEQFETKRGFLDDGNDIKKNLSRKEAEHLVRSDFSAMGYCFQNCEPDSCWVKRVGTGFNSDADWTSVILDEQSLARRRKHAATSAPPAAPRTSEQQGGYNNSGACTQCKGMQFESRCLNITYTTYQIFGFRVCVDRRADKQELRDMLTDDLQEIVRLWPPAVLEQLRQESGIWVNDSTCYPDGDSRRGAFAHWGSHWPMSKGDLGEKGCCAEICSAQDYLDWHSGQPAMLLHELSHCYHSLNMSRLDPVINSAYQAAMASGKYAVGEVQGTVTRGKAPYCATNAQEYFAETSEAFWSSKRFRNDFFPYVNAELRSFDPGGYRMQELAWGVSGASLPSRCEVQEDWAKALAKLLDKDCKAAFRAADRDGSGALDHQEFTVVLRQLGMGPHELTAAMAFSDVDHSGTVKYDEFLTFLTTQVGAYLGARGAKPFKVR